MTYHHLSPIVSTSQWDEFAKRSVAALEKLGITPTKEPRSVLGDKYFSASNGSEQSTYYSKLRSFVKFILLHEEYDDSLPALYPFTPKGALPCSHTAISHFLLYQFQAKGVVVTDHDVSAQESTIKSASWRVVSLVLMVVC